MSLIFRRNSEIKNREEMITEKQKNYIHQLMKNTYVKLIKDFWIPISREEKEMIEPRRMKIELKNNKTNIDTLTKFQASMVITFLLKRIEEIEYV